VLNFFCGLVGLSGNPEKIESKSQAKNFTDHGFLNLPQRRFTKKSDARESLSSPARVFAEMGILQKNELSLPEAFSKKKWLRDEVSGFSRRAKSWLTYSVVCGT
jgi:hypothetical protein